MEDHWLTRAEAQKILRLSDSTMFGLIKSKEIPSIKIGRAYRIRQSDLNRYLENKSVGGKENDNQR